MLSDSRVLAFKPPAIGQQEHPDAKVTGLRLRVGAGGTKTWIFRARTGGRTINKKLGSYPGMDLIADIRTIYDNYAFDTQILVASVRNPIHVHEAAKIGADVMTAPPSVIRQLFKHPLTDSGIKAFLDDWGKTGQRIG